MKSITIASILFVLMGCSSVKVERNVDRPLITNLNTKVNKVEIDVGLKNTSFEEEKHTYNEKNDEISTGKSSSENLASSLNPFDLIPIKRYSSDSRLEIKEILLPVGIKYLVTGEQKAKIDNEINSTIYFNWLNFQYNSSVGMYYFGEIGSEYKKKISDIIWIEGKSDVVIPNYIKLENKYSINSNAYLGIQLFNELSLKAGLNYKNSNFENTVFKSLSSVFSNSNWEETDFGQELKQSYIIELNFGQNIIEIYGEFANKTIEEKNISGNGTYSLKNKNVKVQLQGLRYKYFW